MSYENVLRILNERGIPYTLHEHEPARTADDIRTILAHMPLELCLKCVPFYVKGRPDWVLAAMRANDTADYKKIATLLGIKRDILMRPSPDEMTARLGFESGAVTPISDAPDIRVIIDTGVQGDPLYLGSGRPDHTLEMTLADVMRVTDAARASICKDV